MNPPQISDFLKPKQLSNFCVVSSRTLSSNPNEIHIGDSLQINRFSSGVKEGCSTGLFLTAEDYILPMRFSDTTQSSGCLVEAPNDFVDYVRLAEESVRLWESQKQTKTHESRHRRRYAFAPQPLFLHGLGPWNVPPGAKFSIQVKRAVSVVNIRRQPIEPELRLPVTKRQLVATISCEALHLASKDTMKINSQPGCGPRKPVIFFWTPDYWYRPRSAKDAYVELQNHLQKIRVYHQKRRKCRRFFRRRHIPPPSSDSSDSEGVPKRRKAKKRKSVIRFNMFGGKTQEICNEPRKDSNESSLQFLKRLLRIDVILTAWDFNSTVLAQQLTMIDRDLFLKISSVELNVLIWQQSSKNAPNIQAAIAFSHRISCLVASDILKNECERARSRLIARFINVAYKCHRISNFQSCRTIVFGLQSPAIYRLKSTWAYVRKKHATKYETFEFLCRLYRDPRLLIYQKAFFLTTQNTPYLPFIGDVIAKLLGRIPYYPLKSPVRGRSLQLLQNKTIGHQNCLLTRLLVSLKLLNLGEDVEKGRKGLCDYFEPLDCHEDNRVKCLIETTEFLQQSQLSALHYSFMVNSVAKDYLLKARYREERDNFYESFRVEMVDSSQELCLG